MRRLIVRLSALGIVGLLALPILSASADVPIPVNTATWGSGVYVQDHTQRVFDEETGQAIGKEVVNCQIHVQTLHGVIDEVEYDSIGETMIATDGESSYQATVRSLAGGTVGRATFTGVPPGATLTTTNTDVAVSGTCPGGAPA